LESECGLRQLNQPAQAGLLGRSEPDRRRCLINYPVTNLRDKIINVGTTLREHVRCTYLKNSQYETAGSLSESIFGNCYLKSTCHAR